MRAKKLPTIASNANFSSGTRSGFPNKIAPPVLNFTDGKLPRGKFAAEWQNYIENAIQAQLEVSAAQPFQNWRGVNSTVPDLHGGALSWNPAIGATVAAHPNNTNTIYEITPIGLFIRTRTLVPAAGAFTASDVCYDPITKCTWVAGSCSGATTKSLWKITEGAQVETALPSAAAIVCLTVDHATGIVYALANDANNTVFWFVSGAWATHSTRGSGASAPASAAAYNGELLVVAAVSTPNHDYYTGGAWHTRTDLRSGSDSLSKVRYSVQYASWFVLDDFSGFYVLPGLTGVPVLTPWTGLNAGSFNSCLHEMGYANSPSGSLALYLQIAQEMQPLVFAFDTTLAPTSTWARTQVFYDGSALWFFTQTSAPVNALYQSTRSNAHLS